MSDIESNEDTWLKKHNLAYATATDFSNTNWRKQWDNNLNMFNSKHIMGSKYNTTAYKYKSKLFRPKTRTSIRNTEAAATAAWFSSMEAVSVQPVGDSPEQKAHADILKYLLEYRLNHPDTRWFQTCIGGLQDAQKMGVVCSYNYWKYKEKRTPAKDVNGQSFTETEVIEDRPCIELYPVDQILFHPGASWIDPINTSPFLIRKIPMFVHQVKAEAKKIDEKTGQPKWASCEEADFKQARISYESGVTNTRNQNQQNPQEATVETITDFDMVWVHEVIMTDGDEDQVFYTLHKSKRLTQPVPLSDVYFHGERPITMGCFNLETHRVIAPGVPELGQELQKEANEVVNSRLDNVKLALNKRYLVKRGSQVDLRSLLRNAAGSITMVNDTEGDVKEMAWADVTRSSYEEQNRINADFDTLVGSFDQGSVQTNRSMNETVGGMSMMQGSAGQMTDYGLKTVSETWLEPTLRQVTKLIQHYETDETLVAVAAEKAQIILESDEDAKEIIENMSKNDLLVTVNVGVGASNPALKMNRFIAGINSFTNLAKNATPGTNIEEVSKELFGHLGYKDGSRFFSAEEDPRIKQLIQENEELKQKDASKTMDNQTKAAISQQSDAAAMERQQNQNEANLTLQLIKEHGEDNRVQMNLDELAKTKPKDYNESGT